MKEIKLNKNKIALVDDEDFEFLNQYKWVARGHRREQGKIYRVAIDAENKKRFVYMHREIMNVTDSLIQVAHLNRNVYDNRKENLLILTNENRVGFRKKYRNRGNYIGVSLLRSISKYMARIIKDGIEYDLGFYFTPEEAAMVYDKAAIELYGEEAVTNKKEGLIEYTHLPEQTITFSIARLKRSPITQDDRKRAEVAVEKIVDLKKRYSYKQISGLLEIPTWLINKIITGRKRSLSVDNFNKLIANIEKEKL